ncbi:glycosyltransferase [Maribrevibacterium harenarium]|uniref:Glycosyltransferase n=1 Tax=Maribrevibacterium harenarium TaxID=2589817 RepID=A0A501WZP2_9GAMM|nr:glycosyltransferase [Maribrevibacterium harenarium]TPE54280.1 glycosyltransferase [Maribrevibacterium harenarium]
MRTLIIVRALKTGGMERVAVNLADAFAEQGHESHLLFYKKRKDALYPTHPSVKLHEFNVNRISLANPLSILTELSARLSNLIWRKSYFLIAGWFGGMRLAKKVAQLKAEYGTFDRIIFRGEGTYEIVWGFRHEKSCYVLENVVSAPAGKGSLQTKLRYNKLFAGRDLVSVSHGVQTAAEQTFTQYGITPKSLKVITNPCPIVQIRQQAEAEKPATMPSGPYLVNVARLVPQKGQNLLLEAYAQSQQTLPLVIVGSGKLEQTLKQQAKDLGIADKVHFVGNQANPYVWMKHASLFVLSSEFEGLGIVLFEALACGTPILSVDCQGGVRDVFKGELEQYLCERTPQALAEKMDSLIAQGGYPVKEEWIDDFKPENVVNAFLS